MRSQIRIDIAQDAESCSKSLVTSRETTQNDKNRLQKLENEVGDVSAPSLCYSQPGSRRDLDNIASCSLHSGATFVTSIWEMAKIGNHTFNDLAMDQ